MKKEESLPEFLQVFVTLDDGARAEALAQSLVEARLAGCVQVMGPLRSFYRWQGQVERAEEWLCLIKTRAELYPALEAAIRARHPYEVPEILAVPVSAGLEVYLAWLRAETGAGEGAA